jgi:siroheme synthase-like protein
MLNIETLKILLLGQGDKLSAREAKLKDAGASNLTILNDAPEDFSGFDVVMIVGFDEETSSKFYCAAKKARCLVNVEDNKKYCDFFFQSFVKRGKLIIGVSTGGNSPATAKLIRDKIEQTFPDIWEQHLEEISQKRIEWKSAGKSYEEVDQLTRDYLKKWL